MVWFKFNRLGILLLGIVVGVLVVVGCSVGPSRLSKIIQADDAATYQRYRDQYVDNDAAAWFAWRSDETGRSVDDLLSADDELSQTTNPFVPTDLWAVQRGALIFQASCVECHGTTANGRGSSGQALQGSKDFSDSSMRTAIALSGNDLLGKWYQTIYEGSVTNRLMPDGSYAAMPPMGERLTQEQIWLALTWLASDQKIESEVQQ